MQPCREKKLSGMRRHDYGGENCGLLGGGSRSSENMRREREREREKGREKRTGRDFPRDSG